jgi:hypothetical protein
MVMVAAATVGSEMFDLVVEPMSVNATFSNGPNGNC